MIEPSQWAVSTRRMTRPTPPFGACGSNRHGAAKGLGLGFSMNLSRTWMDSVATPFSMSQMAMLLADSTNRAASSPRESGKRCVMAPTFRWNSCDGQGIHGSHKRGNSGTRSCRIVYAPARGSAAESARSCRVECAAASSRDVAQPALPTVDSPWEVRVRLHAVMNRR